MHSITQYANPYVKIYKDRKYIHPDSHTVIDVAGVEYLLNDASVKAIQHNEPWIPVVQLYDQKIYHFTLKTILKSIQTNGIIDYLKK